MDNVLRLIRFNPLRSPKMEQYCNRGDRRRCAFLSDVYRWDAVNRCFRRRRDEFEVMPGPEVYWAPLPRLVLFEIENGVSAPNQIAVR